MTIEKLVLVPITYWTPTSALTKDRIFTVGLDQVTNIEEQDDGDFLVTLTDEVEDEGTYHRTITVMRSQVRLIHRRELAV
jgi:hypothetical protein